MQCVGCVGGLGTLYKWLPYTMTIVDRFHCTTLKLRRKGVSVWLCVGCVVMCGRSGICSLDRHVASSDSAHLRWTGGACVSFVC